MEQVTYVGLEVIGEKSYYYRYIQLFVKYIEAQLNLHTRFIFPEIGKVFVVFGFFLRSRESIYKLVSETSVPLTFPKKYKNSLGHKMNILLEFILNRKRWVFVIKALRENLNHKVIVKSYSENWIDHLKTVT